jgi:hypothetical protein
MTVTGAAEGDLPMSIPAKTPTAVLHRSNSADIEHTSARRVCRFTPDAGKPSSHHQ